MKKLPDKQPEPFAVQFPGTPHDALDSLRRMLEIHPTKRATVDESLKHPFFSALHSPSDETTPNRPFDFSFENEHLHRLRLQELIWKEVGDFRPYCLPVAPIRGTVVMDVKSSRKDP